MARASDQHGHEHSETDLSIDPEWTARILVQFIDTEVRRTGRQRVVIGLSGGIDSAVATYLAARALGPDSVFATLMPYKSSHPDSLRDAEAIVSDLGIRSETVDVTPIVEGFATACGRPAPLRFGNVMARARMIVLFDRSEEHAALVLGTSNKTELLLGYGTLQGDLASALNPIGDLYKTQVRALAAHLGVPRAIIDKPPSADLWPDQSDEDEIGYRYEDLDRLLVMLVDSRVSRRTAIDEGFAEEMVDRVTRMIVRSQFKRRLPIIAKVSLRSVGWDFRYPRDWLT